MQILRYLCQSVLKRLQPKSKLMALSVVVIVLPISVNATESLHSLNAVERQKNQLAIQYEYTKDNPITSNKSIVFNKIAQNIYLAKYYGANAGLVVGKHGLLLIESKGMLEEGARKLLAAVRKISDKPIKYVINTHSHFDHSGGNAFFAEKGATVIAQENYRFTPIAHHLRFDEKLTLTMGSEEVIAYHAPSHTLDSTIIHLPNSNVIFMGDNFSSSWLLYEGANGGSGYRKTMDVALSLIDSKTIIVPGHGELSHVDGLIKNDKAKSAFRKKIGQLFAKGWTVKQISENKAAQDILKNYQGVKNDGSPIHIRKIQDIIDANFIEPIVISKALQNRYVGQYKMISGKIVEIVKVDGKLIARMEGSFIAQLKAMSTTRFDLVGFPYTQGETIEFTDNGGDNTLALTIKIPESFVMNYWLEEGTGIKIK
jgi:glyoxylase-like metal-dependent hydrolase (beta-lactamase superfamily II)